MSRWRWIFRQVTKRLWLRASLIGSLGVAAAIIATVAERYIPWELPGTIGAAAVDSILAIIASSMLAVTTFSLNVMTAAFAAATNNVTPRATRLLMEDRVTQNVLSTFIGSFLFSIVGIIVLKTGAYGDRGRVVLFVVAIGVVALIVLSLLRWIDHLMQLGRVGETTDRVEHATEQAIKARIKEPCLGGVPLRQPVGASGTAVSAERVGYVQFVDMPALSRCAEELECDIHLGVMPGTFVYPDTPLAQLSSEQPMEAGKAKRVAKSLRDAFSIGDSRSFDQDPRFGLAVMCEIGSRALSAAINDSGTAIDVIGRMTRLMSLFAPDPERKAKDGVLYPRIHVPVLKSADLFEDAFMTLGRDGAGLIEVQLRLQKALIALSRMGDEDFRSAALFQSKLALARAEAAFTLDADRERLHEAMHQHADHAPGAAGQR